MSVKLDRVLVVGLGAIGAPYAMAIHDSKPGIEVLALVPDSAVASYREHPVMINGTPLRIPLANDFHDPEPVDLVLVAVKHRNLSQAMDSMSSFITSHTCVLSLMNGIYSEEIIASRFGWDRVLYTTCLGVDSNREGKKVRLNSIGRIQLGQATNIHPDERVTRLKEFFCACGIPADIPADMRLSLWRKLLINVGMNQVSAVLDLTYGEFRENASALEIMRAAQQEVILVANAEGIELGDKDIHEWETQLAMLSEDGMSSMLQDVRTGRATEVDAFGGVVIALGKKHGISTPVNNFLVNKINDIEANRSIGKSLNWSTF
jgi:2-dehydropantoate 2-reductase